MWKIIALLPCLGVVTACSPESPFGFRLPDGDAAAGQRAFVELRCNACHDVSGVDIEYLEGIAHVLISSGSVLLRCDHGVWIPSSQTDDAEP